MIKLIASDLDGTLLQNEAQELTPRAIELIRALTQKGVHFVAASGRQYANERLLFHEIKDDISYIAENGSLCIHQGKVISRGLIEDDLAYRILRELKKEPGFEIVVSREDTCLIENNNSQFANHIVNVIVFIPINTREPTIVLLKSLPLNRAEYGSCFTSFGSSVTGGSGFPVDASISFSIFVRIASASSTLPCASNQRGDSGSFFAIMMLPLSVKHAPP